MSKHNEVGKIGEEAAVAFLKKLEYQIIETNWHYNYKEIDIIAKQDNEMVFIEVKTRSNLAFELPQEAVTIKKMKNLVYAADAYLVEHNISLESRFDIITVLAKNPPIILEHIKQAFYPNDLI